MCIECQKNIVKKIYHYDYIDRKSIDISFIPLGHVQLNDKNYYRFFYFLLLLNYLRIVKSNLFLLILRGKKTLYIIVDGHICAYLPHKTMMRQWCKCCLHFFSIIEYRRTTLVNVVYNEVHSLSPRSGWTATNLNTNICSIKATVFKINKQTSRWAMSMTKRSMFLCIVFKFSGENKS